MEVRPVKVSRRNTVEPFVREIAKAYGVTVRSARRLFYRAIESTVVSNEILDQIDFYMTEELADEDGSEERRTA